MTTTAVSDPWQARAACRGQDTNGWFGQPHETRSATATCAICPVRPDCLYDALRSEPPSAPRYGIRGGLSGRERNRIPPLPSTTAEAIAYLRDYLDDLDALDPEQETHPMPEPTTPQPLPEDELLEWGDTHADPEVQDQAARARVILAGLRNRHASDRELSAITEEEEKIAARLAELRTRKVALLPPKKSKSKGRGVDYPAAEVRAWAAANGHQCSPTGRIAKPIVDAWRAATGQTEGAAGTS